MRKFLRFVFSKKFIVVLLALIQILAFIMLTTRLYTIGSAIYVVLIMFSIGVMLYLFERDNLNPAYKLLQHCTCLLRP